MDIVTRPFRSGPRFHRLDLVTGTVDTAHLIAVHDETALYNVESASGERFRHRVSSVADFENRWFFPR